MLFFFYMYLQVSPTCSGEFGSVLRGEDRRGRLEDSLGPDSSLGDTFCVENVHARSARAANCYAMHRLTVHDPVHISNLSSSSNRE